MTHWFYLMIAALFEAAWIFSLKFLNMKQLFSIKMNQLQSISEWKIFLPFGGYIVFGLCNIYFFSLAMKSIPASTAFAVWMAMALIFSKILDIFVFNEAYNYQQIFFTGVVLLGIVGLKYYSKA